MTKIQPIGQANTCHLSKVNSNGATPTQTSFDSTLQSASEKKGRGLKILLFPFTWVWSKMQSFGKFLMRTLCCFCNAHGPREILDWHQAKETFSKVYTPVVTSTGFLTDRTKAFQKALGELSSATTERFYQHIGFAIAAQQRPAITDRSEQEKFYKEKCTRQEIRGYLGNIESPVVVQAVKSFQKELEEKTRS